MQDESPKDIIIVINDNAQDGKDISWLWDVDFDLFGGIISIPSQSAAFAVRICASD